MRYNQYLMLEVRRVEKSRLEGACWGAGSAQYLDLGGCCMYVFSCKNWSSSTINTCALYWMLHLDNENKVKKEKNKKFQAFTMTHIYEELTMPQAQSFTCSSSLTPYTQTQIDTHISTHTHTQYSGTPTYTHQHIYTPIHTHMYTQTYQ